MIVNEKLEQQKIENIVTEHRDYNEDVGSGTFIP